MSRYLAAFLLVSATSAPRVTIAEFQYLRWIEGRWRGTNEGVPFYQAFHFRNDSTIETRTFGDSTFREASDSGLIILENGVIRNRGGGEDAEWTATSLDSRTIHFEPTGKAGNSFTWHRISPTQWSATIRWREPSGKQQQRLYLLERVTT